MARPFDSTTKQLVELSPSDWLAYAGLPGLEADVLEADLSTVSPEADKVLRIKHPNPWLVHLEFQSSYDADLPERSLQYNVLLHRRHRLPVQSILILLRPAADGPAMSGGLEHVHTDGRTYLSFGYQVIRAWQKPVDEVLSAGLAALPMAPLANIPTNALPGIIHEIERRIEFEATPQDAGFLWTATYVLMGLRYPDGMIHQLLKGVRAMEDSVTYQAIIEKGRTKGITEEAKAILLRQGSKRFGTPKVTTKRMLESITSVDRLEALLDRVLEVESWDELLANN